MLEWVQLNGPSRKCSIVTSKHNKSRSATWEAWMIGRSAGFLCADCKKEWQQIEKEILNAE